MRFLLFIFALSIFTHAGAARWTIDSVEDPITGGTCTVQKLLRYGTYTEESDAIYDLVFFPEDQFQMLWFCEESGYVSFSQDFADISKSERLEIAQFLASNYSKAGADSHSYRLWLLEELYRLRDTDPHFWRNFYRRVAVLNEKLANKLRFKALSEIEKEQSTPNGEMLYLKGEYYRIAGDIELAHKFLCEAQKSAKEDDNRLSRLISNRLEKIPNRSAKSCSE